MESAILVMTLVLVVATLLPFWRSPHWVVRSMDFPRVQLALLAVLIVVTQWWQLDRANPLTWVLMGLSLLCLGWQLWWILPYTRVWPVEVRSARDDDRARHLSILTANVLMPNRRADLLLALVQQHWVVRSMDFPRVQLALLAVLIVVTQWWQLDRANPLTWVLMGLSLLCLGWQLWWILPYTRVWPVEVRSARDDDRARHLSILTANVLMPNRRADLLLALVQQHSPDVLVTLESDQWWQSQLDTLEADMPYSIKCPLDNLYGMHVYSRLPLEDAEVAYLVEAGVPSIHAQVVLRSGDRVRVHFLHPAPPSPTENSESSERDAELIVVARSLDECDRPVVVSGDLNDVAWSATTRLFRKISGLLDPRVGRGMFNTFHAGYPFVRWPLDHLFHSRHFTVRSIQRLPDFGSDHFALLTELALTPVQGQNQAGLNGDGDDRAWAQTIANEQDVSAKDVPRPGE